MKMKGIKNADFQVSQEGKKKKRLTLYTQYGSIDSRSIYDYLGAGMAHILQTQSTISIFVNERGQSE